jgi:hypothetical protein
LDEILIKIIPDALPHTQKKQIPETRITIASSSLVDALWYIFSESGYKKVLTTPAAAPWLTLDAFSLFLVAAGIITR